MVEIAIPKHGPKLGEGFSQEEKLKAIEIHRQTDPKRGYQTPAAFVSALASLHKIIILCSFCRPKFNPRKNHYRNFVNPGTRGMFFNGVCDGCGALGSHVAFIHEEEYPKVCIGADEARQRRVEARARWKEYSPSRFIEQNRR